MNISNIRSLLSTRMAAGFDFHERRPGYYQLIIPISHEDGDMVDIYLQDSPLGESHVRICDCAITLMRLSYSYDLTTSTRQRVFNDILVNNGVEYEEGNLYVDTPVDMLYEGIMQFAGCIHKVCNMRYWTKETVRSTFHEDLNEYIEVELKLFSPICDQSPLPNDGLYSVDWTLTYNKRNFYLFGVRGNNKAKNVTITLLELQKAGLPFISLIVHEAMEDLGRKERQYLTRNADRQYPVLRDFKESSRADLKRLAPQV